MKSPIDFANELKELMVKHNVNTMKPSNMEALLDTKAEIFMTNFTVEFNGEPEYNEVQKKIEEIVSRIVKIIPAHLDEGEIEEIKQIMQDCF